MVWYPIHNFNSTELSFKKIKLTLSIKFVFNDVNGKLGQVFKLVAWGLLQASEGADKNSVFRLT